MRMGLLPIPSFDTEPDIHGELEEFEHTTNVEETNYDELGVCVWDGQKTYRRAYEESPFLNMETNQGHPRRHQSFGLILTKKPLREHPRPFCAG